MKPYTHPNGLPEGQCQKPLLNLCPTVQGDVSFDELSLDSGRACDVNSIALPTAVRNLVRHKGCSSLLPNSLV